MAVKFKFLTAWLPLLMSGTAALLLAKLGLTSSIEPFTQHLIFQAHSYRPWNEDIVLITIDEKSINALGWFPWKRDRHTQLLQQLTAAEVKTVAFNILFSEETAEDAAFAQAIADHGQVLLANAWYQEKRLLSPNQRLASKAIAVGHMTQVQTSLPVSVKPHINGHPALAIATAQVHQLSQNELKLFAVTQPLLPHWPAPVSQLQQYSFVDVMEQRVPKEALQGKIALVGMTAEGFDPLVSPIEPNKPVSGIHLHAALIHSYLEQNFLHRPNQHWGVLGLILWAIGLRYGLSRLTERKQLITLAIGIIIWPVIAILALNANILLPISLPILLLVSTGFSLLVISNTRLRSINSQLQSKATTDALTGIRNRAFFNDYSAYLWHRCVREQQSLCLILCDVDHFKQYNDTYGHLVGDHCLYQVAQSLQFSLYRSSDIVARYGGEEFVILLSDANLEHGCTVAKRIQDQLGQRAIPHKSSSCSDLVTLSFGIACIRPTRNDRLETLIDQADKALYRAKLAGRDRYMVQQL